MLFRSAEMTALGLPVPPGFTVTTEAYRRYLAHPGPLPPDLHAEVARHLGQLEVQTGKHFGDPLNPLLLSVRSGGPVSMPGMMETVLNLGLTDAAIRQAPLHDLRFMLDAYRRLIQMYGEVVAGIDHARFTAELKRVEEAHSPRLTIDALFDLVQAYGDVYLDATGAGFPQDPREQLFAGIAAVFESWNAPRAHVYRAECGISEAAGTAANVMQMVFGNRDVHSATGVCFSRDPATGRPGLYGEFLVRAQGEDVVSGTETPGPVAEMRQVLPAAYDELAQAVARLEAHYGDGQDVEFTVESGRLYILRTRAAKRPATAALRAAVDLTAEGLGDRALGAGRRVSGSVSSPMSRRARRRTIATTKEER